MEYMINGSKITVERKEEEKGMTILEGLINSFIIKENLTIINFTSNLYDAEFSDKLVLLSHFKVIGEYLKNDIYIL